MEVAIHCFKSSRFKGGANKDVNEGGRIDKRKWHDLGPPMEMSIVLIILASQKNVKRKVTANLQRSLRALLVNS